MSNNICVDEVTVPYYAVHDDGKICGFFGIFRFLSNFYPLENGIWYEDLTYPSVENAYQAAKYPYNNRIQFTTTSAPESKRLGKLAPKFDSKKWNKHKHAIMSAMVYQKFEKNNKLKEMLYMTDGCILEERNNWGDTYWGTNVDGVGENNLGKILMNVRDNLKQADKHNIF